MASSLPSSLEVLYIYLGRVRQENLMCQFNCKDGWITLNDGSLAECPDWLFHEKKIEPKSFLDKRVRWCYDHPEKGWVEGNLPLWDALLDLIPMTVIITLAFLYWKFG